MQHQSPPAGIPRPLTAHDADRRDPGPVLPNPVLEPFSILATPMQAAEPITAPRGCFRLGLWRLADPKISLASMAGLFLGACVAWHDGPLEWTWLFVAVLGIFCLEVAKAASGELFDFDSGADLAVGSDDRSPFSGGKRVLVEGLLTRRQTIAIAAVAYGLGIAAGLAVVIGCEVRVLWIGLAGVGLAYFYEAPPLKLAYRGWGELAVAAAYGPLIAAGLYLLERHTLPLTIVAAGLPLGILIAAFLWINEFPDYHADRAAGKRNLVVRLGRRRASLLFAGWILLAQILIALLPVWGLPLGSLLGWTSLVPGAIAAQILIEHSDHTRQIVPAQALTLASFLTYAITGGLGILLTA
ncbi:MAG: prenyltransferase [Planctomycetota bacterium]